MRDLMKGIVFLLVLASHLAAADTVRHVPPGDAIAGATVELVAEADAATPQLVAHVRVTGAKAYREIELVRRDEAHWVAVVPAIDVVVPGLEYYLAAEGQPVFASPEVPHTIEVRLDDADERKGHDLVRSGGRRSRIHTMAEWVDYGTRTVGTTRVADHYYRVDADFAYRLWAYPLEEIRVGYTRLLGDTQSMACPTPTPCTAEAGFKVAGWFELGLAPVEGFRLDARMMVMATPSGVGVGGRGELRLGDRDGSHVAVGVEGMQDVGASGFFRLGWGTVPKFPMTATVEVSDLPSSERPTGVRLYYDIAHEVGGGVRLGVRIGYAARVQQVAGITGGVGANVDF
ncbi:MAG: hypothetical protein ABI591_21385 [Kofleriaceae bacterium]